MSSVRSLLSKAEGEKVFRPFVKETHGRQCVVLDLERLMYIGVAGQLVVVASDASGRDLYYGHANMTYYKNILNGEQGIQVPDTERQSIELMMFGEFIGALTYPASGEVGWSMWVNHPEMAAELFIEFMKANGCEITSQAEKFASYCRVSDNHEILSNSSFYGVVNIEDMPGKSIAAVQYWENKLYIYTKMLAENGVDDMMIRHEFDLPHDIGGALMKAHHDNRSVQSYYNAYIISGALNMVGVYLTDIASIAWRDCNLNSTFHSAEDTDMYWTFDDIVRYHQYMFRL